MKILSVGSEIFPLVKTGGLADVLGALPRALAAEDIEVRTLVPGYPAVMAALAAPETVHEWDQLFGGTARLVSAAAGDLRLLVLDAPHLFARPGNPYTGPDGTDWPDNAMRFAALAQAAALLGQRSLAVFQPDIVHAHDWQAGLAPAYLHYAGIPHAPSVMTVHNLAYQGQFPAYMLGMIGLPPQAYAMDGVEYYGSIGYLKAGLYFADAITTVSPGYAAELQTDEGGMGLAGLFRSRATQVFGILNGIDTTVWNPASDCLIPANFDAASLDGRGANKAALQNRLGLAIDPGRLLIAVVSRLAWQKGLDLLHAVLPALTGMGAQLAILGSGEAALEAGFAAAARQNPHAVACVFGFDESLAHLMQAGSDAVLVPSRFEPCGLTQLIAQRYGSIPIVARVGGLSDTVIDANEVALAAGVATGIQFSPVTGDALSTALHRAMRLWRQPARWQAMQQNGMALDLSWNEPAEHYAALYRRLVK
jgi:starch synthase